MRKGIWNGSSADRMATRIESATMLARYVGKTPEALVTM